MREHRGQKKSKTRAGSTHQHRNAARVGEARSVACSVLTVSDSRTVEEDTSGDLLVALLEADGHTIVTRHLLPDDPAQVGAWIDAQVADGRVQAILTTGGTGIARRDATIDAVRARLAIELPGFGELFRMISYDEVGAAAMLSRAIAGVALGDRTEGDPGVIVFAMPGSKNAVETAMRKLVLPEISHLVWERRR
jgi:molybdenum cofactor biosynthesis protein B